MKLVSFFVLVFVLGLACGPVPRRVTTVHEYDRTLLQSAATMPPAGPVGVGPLAESKALSLELDGWTSPRLGASPEARKDGAPGQLQAFAGGQVRILTGLGQHVETGLGFEATHTAFASPLASDLPAQRDGGQLLFRTGPHLRVEAPLIPKLVLELNSDLRASRLVVNRYLYVVETVTDTADERSVTDERSTNDREVFIAMQVRMGLGLGWKPSPGLHLSLGGMLQTTPFVDGYEREQWRCVKVDGEGEGCEPPALPEFWRSKGTGTIYVGGGIQAGEGLWLLPRAWYNAPDEEGVSKATPLGAGLAVRATFR